MLKNKSHIFFDLDYTLWDYDRNCAETLIEIFELFELEKIGIPTSQIFIEKFHRVNNKLWDLYDTRKITSEELRSRRFSEIFDLFGIDNKSICGKIHDTYMQISPNKPHLHDGTLDILEYLKTKYTMHIITNGLDDIQSKKMVASGIIEYFDTITTSQKANARKPEKEIFEYAVKIAKTTVNQSVMIGDNYNVDIIGAKNIGMDFVFFNLENKIFAKDENSMIKHLLELKQIL